MAEIKTNPAEPTPSVDPSTPTVEELMAQLSEAQADRDRYKTANDKLSKSEAEIKRQLRAKQTEDERKAEELAEAQRIKDEELENLRAKSNRYEAMSSYKTMDEKTVDKLIEAVGNADHSAIAKILETEISNAVKKAESEWLADRPRVNAGVGGEGAMTREQILAVKDTQQRQKLIAENIDLFS